MTNYLNGHRNSGAERHFFAEANVAFDPDTGMTYDGHALDASTGGLPLRGCENLHKRCFFFAQKVGLVMFSVTSLTDGFISWFFRWQLKDFWKFHPENWGNDPI